jgi:ribosome biogenesis GTPase A
VTHDVDGLQRLLSELAAIVPSPDAAAVDELQRRVAARVLRVLVVGEAKRGKSTLINALVGREVLPTGVVPLTAVATTVVHGDDECLDVRLVDGSVHRHDLADLADLVTETGNPANQRGITDVVARLSTPSLAGGVELVDTPGVGSVHTHNTTEATQALGRMDAAVFVLTGDPPISDSEREFLRHVRENAVTVFCVLNKIDRLTPDEVTEAREFTEQVLAEELGVAVPVWPLSARTALQRTQQPAGAGGTSDDGFVAFASALTDYLTSSRTADLARSVAVRGERLARSVAETHAATLAALSMSEQDMDSKLRVFDDRFTAVNRDRTETQGIVASELQRLLAETNELASDLRRQSEGPLLAAVRERLTAGDGSMRQTEEDALAVAADQIHTTVEGWRARRAKELDAAITDLDHRLNERLRGHIAAVRDAASSLFDLDLPPVPASVGLSGQSRFGYRFQPDPGQLDTLTASLRHHLPAAISRRQVHKYVLTRAADLLDKHVGRARADFQQQLAETRRRVDAELARRFDEAAGRLADAVRIAGRLRREQVGQVEALRRQAETGQAAASRLAGQFAAVDAWTRTATGG